MLRLKPLAALFFVSVVWGSAWANEGSWDDVKEIPRHQRIKVIAKDMKSVEGRFANATDDAIIVRVGQSEERISRPNVLRVTLVGRRKGRLNMLLGAAIGGAAGLGFYGAFGGGDEGGAALLVPLAAVGAGIGAGAAVGALVPTGSRTIYRVTATTAKLPP